MKELIINTKENRVIYRILSAIKEEISEFDVSYDLNYSIEFLVEEVFTNIVKHGYKNEEGIVKIRYDILNNPLRLHMIFIDNAEKFNPLQAEEPDLSDDLDEREVGSLGIYLIRQYADELEYEHVDNQNVFSIVKILEGE